MKSEQVLFPPTQHPDKPTANPTSYPPVQGAIYPGVMELGHEANHWPPTSVAVQKVWSYTSTYPHFFMAWCLLGIGNTFSITFIFQLVVYFSILEYSNYPCSITTQNAWAT